MLFKIGNLSASDLKEKYGTPLYVYDEAQIKQNINEYKDNFKSNLYETKIIYASKAFSSLYMYKLVKENNIGVDVVSGGELYGVIKEKINPNDIHFHGNNKSEAEMDMAIDYKVKNIIGLADYMVCGPFKLEERDITLPMVGSRNQYVVDLKDYK